MPLYALGPLRPQTPTEGSYWVAPDANIIGQVELGEDVGIWFGATLRGDNEPIRIGARTNIQEAVIIHVDPGHPVSIGEGCTIGHRAIVHGCTIGDNSLIGAPAKMVRTLDDAAVEGLKRSAEHYVKNWQRYAAQFTLLD